MLSVPHAAVDRVEPLVSILIPAYEHARFVEATLGSVAAQDYPRLEVLVLDDGSRDGTAGVAEAFIAARPGCFERARVWSQPNAGVSATLNRLFDAATGDVVMPVASDDLLLPGAVRYRMDVLAAAPEALALFTDCVVIGDDGELQYESGIRDLYMGNLRALATNRSLAASLILRWCVPGSVMSMRREALISAGLGRADEALNVEDFDIYLRLALAGRLRFDLRPTAAYRLHEGQTIHALDGVLEAQAERTFQKVRLHARGLSGFFVRDYFVRQQAANQSRTSVRRLWHAAQRRAAMAAYRLYVGHSPFGTPASGPVSSKRLSLGPNGQPSD